MKKSTASPSGIDWSAYRFPAEWEAHDATWLAWPHNAETWPDTLESVQETYLEIIRALIPGERVYLLARDCASAEEINEKLRHGKIESPNVKVVTIPNNDAWLRDSGPTFMLRRDSGAPRRVAHDFIFNTWGKKYGPWDLDDQIPVAACRMVNTPCESHDFVLEGGSIDTDGQGTLLTTEQCLLNPNRNPSLSREGIEERLRHWLGIRQVIWLGEGLEGDDTDGHVDDLTRFIAPGVVATVVESDPHDPNHRPLADNLRRLRLAKDARGQTLKIVELPMPPRLEGPFGRSPASHANFYIGNTAVLIPFFGGSTDQKILQTLAPFFPGRKMVGIDCRTLVGGLGAIHCITQQQPSINPPPPLA
ncbi:MAG: agmatine deiminase family protein [Verrucomicrobia bacterium]|nr:agmatine deiminase family protein [Verrucomicrobiota bacterium]